LSHREYICTKDGSTQFNTGKQSSLHLHIQKAILLSLEAKKLISKQQRVQCAEILERQQR